MTIASSDSQSNSVETSFLRGISPKGAFILKVDLVNIIGYLGLFMSFKNTFSDSLI